MKSRHKIVECLVPGFAAILFAASITGCGLDIGGGASPTALAGEAGERDEDTTPEPVVPPPDDPPPPSADPFDEPSARGGPVVDPESEAEEPGPRFGELKQLSVGIEFSGASGTTVTDESGINYIVGDWTSSEDKVYPSEYWGTYPLYFFGQEVGITVNVTNLGPRRNFSLVVRTEAYCLCTDGSNGATLLAPTETEIVVARGETVRVDSSFVAGFVEGAESGLDRLIVKVLHPNVVDNPSGDEPALLLQKEAVFCPPEHGPPAAEDAF